MKSSSAQRLRELNQTFYDSFATEFSNSRHELNRGIVRALRSLGRFDSLLDVGCGDGRVGHALASDLVDHPVARYLGVDFSTKLLQQGVREDNPLPDTFHLSLSDFSMSDWIVQTRHLAPPYDTAVCFAALHHMPDSRSRLQLLRDIRSLLRPGGACVISVWQFMHVPRLRRKVVDWSKIGLTSADVDEGDYLLNWLRGGRGLRYVHHFDEAELVELCQQADFSIRDTYRSDGETGDLSLYIMLETGY